MLASRKIVESNYRIGAKHISTTLNDGTANLGAIIGLLVDFLQRASELKSHFLSNMSHEFRTPLNSILALSQTLLDRMDGDLSKEQEKQVNFIRKSAQDLADLVNHLLDLAKVEAGKVTICPTAFKVETLLAALRGMLRPLLAQNSSVSLVFEEPMDVPQLHTDEGKVSQILRNFISNALKFTEQ
jgi:signal transduction histidine kinase